MPELRFPASESFTAGVRGGNGPPSDSLGVNGQFYVDNLNKVWYGPKANGVWGAGTPIVQGPVGPEGPQGVQGPAGPKGVNPRGVWSSAATYEVDDLVRFGGAEWRALRTNTNVTPEEAASLDWTLFVDVGGSGPQGPEGPQGQQGPVGPAGTINTIQSAGTAQPQQPFLNFTGDLSAADDSVGTRTNVSVKPRPEVIAIAANYSNYSLTLTANTWTRLNNGTAYAPEMTFGVLGTPPAGTQWRVDVLSSLRITPPGAGLILLGCGIGTAWTLGATHGGLRAESANSVVAMVMAPALVVPDPTTAFTVTMAIWSNTAGSYTIGPDRPIARAYLAAL